MKRIILLIAITTIVGSLATTTALAQQRVQNLRGCGNAPVSVRGRMYSPASLETISGEVISVDRMTPIGRGRGGGGVHLLVKTNQETIEVHLGPAWYLENQNFSVAQGDRLEIKGSRVSTPGTLALIAAQVKKGNEVLVLRNEKGFPVWSGRHW